MTTIFEGRLFADYHQIYLADAAGGADYSGHVTDEAIGRRVVALDDVLAVFTARDMDVPVRIDLHEREPDIDLDGADHAVRGGLKSSGILVVAGCSDYLPDAARLPVPPGHLTALVVFTGLGTPSDDGLGGGDRYVIHLWPGKADGVRVLKQWQGPEA